MFHCLVIKVFCLATSFILYHIFPHLSTTFFKFFRSFFKPSCGFLWFLSFPATACSLYHLFRYLSTVFFIFLKSIQIVSISEAVLCDSSFTLPLSFSCVNPFFYFFTKSSKKGCKRCGGVPDLKLPHLYPCFFPDSSIQENGLNHNVKSPSYTIRRNKSMESSGRQS